MRPFRKEDLLDEEEYKAKRAALRDQALLLREARRLRMGQHFTFAFENRETLLQQLHENLLLAGQGEVDKELAAINSLLPPAKGLLCTLFFEYQDPREKDEAISALWDLPAYVFVRTQPQKQLFASYDKQQNSEDEISVVQYLHFDVGGAVPQSLGIDHLLFKRELELDTELRQLLKEDLNL